MPIQIRNEQQEVDVDIAALKRTVRICLQKLKLPKAEISILLTDEQTIKNLNRSYRGINRPTDILSFGMREQKRVADPMPPHPNVLGDLVVSVPIIRHQAEKRGVAVMEELDFIVIHGILHLLGYDHAGKRQKLQMDKIHAVLLQALRKR